MDKKELQYAAVLPVSDVLLLPETDAVLRINEIQQKQFQEKGQVFLALTRKNRKPDAEMQEADFHSKGLLFLVDSIVNGKDGTTLTVHILSRAKVNVMYRGKDGLYASYEVLEDTADLNESSYEDMLNYMKKAVAEIGENFRGGEQFSREVNNFSYMNTLMVYLAQFLPLTEEERSRLIETDSIRERSLLFIDYLLRQRELLKLNIQMNEKFSERANKFYRKQALQEQLRAIQEELHEDDSEETKKADYPVRIKQSEMPEDVKKVALEEAKKLESAGREGMEQNVIRNYLDFLLALPWAAEEAKNIDLAYAREILNTRHYGLDKVKDRIIQHLAVMRLKNENKGSALLLVGPPGTGKTSLGKSIAEALGRKYIRMSLGGIRDEAEIRGHRRTYVGAMPGRILQSMKRAGITKVLIPKDNTSDLKDVPEEIKSQLTIIPVSTIEDVLKETLGLQLPRMDQVLWSGAAFGTPVTNITG